MTNYTFEIMNVAHFDEAANLWKEELGLSPNDTIHSISAYLKRNQNMSYVCKLDPEGGLVGAILAGHDGRHGYIYHLAVKKGHRRNGIAKKLVNMSKEALLREGMHRINIGLDITNSGAAGFWKKCGWRKLESLDFYSISLKDSE